MSTQVHGLAVDIQKDGPHFFDMGEFDQGTPLKIEFTDGIGRKSLPDPDPSYGDSGRYSSGVMRIKRPALRKWVTLLLFFLPLLAFVITHEQAPLWILVGAGIGFVLGLGNRAD